METHEIKTKKCDCVEQCESCTGVQPVETEEINWNKISNISVNRYLSKYEDAVIYVIKTGFQDRFVTILEDAPTSSIEKLFEGTKIETEEKFNVKLFDKTTEHCHHEYSDGTGTGWNVCKKCGDMY